MENTKCNFCGSDQFEKREVEYIYRRKGRYLIVHDVPCEVCLNCSERYYPAEALLAIENRFKAIHEKKREPQGTLAVPVESFALVAA